MVNCYKCGKPMQKWKDVFGFPYYVCLNCNIDEYPPADYVQVSYIDGKEERKVWYSTFARWAQLFPGQSPD